METDSVKVIFILDCTHLKTYLPWQKKQLHEVISALPDKHAILIL